MTRNKIFILACILGIVVERSVYFLFSIQSTFGDMLNLIGLLAILELFWPLIWKHIRNAK